MPEDERDGLWSVTREGVEHVIGWCRFQLQLCELTHSGEEWWAAQEDGEVSSEDDHEVHRVAFMTFLLTVPWAQYFDIELEIGEGDGYEDYESEYDGDEEDDDKDYREAGAGFLEAEGDEDLD